MAFSKGKESKESGSFKLYTGVGSMKVLAVNPKLEELEALYGREINGNVEYLSEAKDFSGQGNSIPQVRIDFIVKADPDKHEGVDFVNKVTFFLTKSWRYNRDQSKVQIIDKYGRTAWATKEEYKNKAIPVYSNGNQANIDKDYRLAYTGEEDLTKFVIAYLGISNPQNYVNGQWVMKPENELLDCEARLDCIEDYFKGNFNELREVIGYQPNNKVKVLWGINTNNEGRQFERAYTRMFLKNGVNDYSRLAKDVEAAKNAGGYPTTEFQVSEFHEYVVTPTNLSQPESSDLPFDNPTDDPFAL